MASVISLTNGYGPAFNINNVVDKVVLNYASLGENSNKFYIMELQEGSGAYPYRIYTEYGRMGKNPRKEGRYFNDRGSAYGEFHKILSQKKGKGYEPVEVDDGSSFSPSMIKVKEKRTKDLSSVKDKVLKFIGKIYQETTDFLVTSIDTPLGKLSANQVAKGYDILRKIEEDLDTGYTYSLEHLSNQFYSIIPVAFGSRADYNKLIIDDYYKLNEKKDLLGIMDSVVNVQKDLESTLEEKYKALNIELKALSKRTKEYKRIVEKVSSTKGHNHHFNMDIKEIYEVVDMAGFDKFNPYKCTTMELFHGSRNQNILGILQNGLKIKPKSAVHTGSMFGSGIYFADSSTKSANYCWGWGHNRYSGDDEHYMFLCDVATGNIKEYENAQPHLVSAPYGYNSVMGKKGSSLIHDEYIVYHENQVKLRYIIEFVKK